MFTSRHCAHVRMLAEVERFGEKDLETMEKAPTEELDNLGLRLWLNSVFSLHVIFNMMLI